ncbi:MAG: hypothetical protein NC453_21775 [Muribaculum sp.]|nr:hypothetical protein [Muribaculum sp.]
MLYLNPDIKNLPTLLETVNIVRKMVQQFPVVHRGPFTPIVEDEDAFILTRTDWMYSLKPNITNQGAIFGWCNYFQDIESTPDPLKSSLYREKNPNYLLNNIIREDFEIILESHPLYSLLKFGIDVPKLRRPIKIDNPYGVAHSYGLPSPFISLTSSIDIAAFHACHTYDCRTGKFVPITDNNKTGLIFVFELRGPFAMTLGLSTIGKQAFQRPGNNKLFAYQCRPDVVFASLPFVKGFQFRQTTESTDLFDKIFGQGRALNPREIISDKLSELLDSRSFSEQAFKRNLFHNPKDNPTVNLHRLADAGLSRKKTIDFEFTSNELRATWFDDVEDNWEDFWDGTIFPMLNESQYNALLDLPNNPNYRMYFDQSLWENRPLR